MKAQKGQITLDLFVAILISIFIFTTIQGYLLLQTDQTQETGINQELQRKTTAIGTIMNNFYASNPENGDYSAIIDPGIKDFLTQPTTTVTKGTNDEELTITVDYGEGKQATYTYPVPTGIEYDSSCNEVGGEPCVRG